MNPHLEFLVEDASTEEFLRALLPRFLPEGVTFEVRRFRGKPDMLNKLEGRLRGYVQWLPENYRLFVLLDLDEDDCRQLKSRLEETARRAGLRTRSGNPGGWQVVNRIAIEELEAWFFGDWDAVRTCFARASRHVPQQRNYRDPDAIRGGTWEALERLLKRAGYFRQGLPKLDLARRIGEVLDPDRNRSRSFRVFWAAVQEAAGH